MSMNKEYQESAARAYRASIINRPTNLTPSRTIMNSSSVGLYTGLKMNATRPGADEHKNIASRNSGSVLKRVIDLGAIGGTGPDFVRTHARSDNPETSKDAALKAAKFSATHQGKILQSLHEKGPQTAKEIAVNTGFTSVQVSRRLGDMERAKIIEPTGQVREGCREFIANS